MEMRNQVMLKHNPGEKSLKAPFTIYLDLQLDISLLAGRRLKNVHLIKKKINLIITEEKIVLRYYVKN